MVEQTKEKPVSAAWYISDVRYVHRDVSSANILWADKQNTALVAYSVLVKVHVQTLETYIEHT